MKNKKSFKSQTNQIFRSLIATAFLANGIFQMVAPALAIGTAAGQTLDNTATATYQDPNDTSTTLNATSNKVSVTIAEVAGITLDATSTTFKSDSNGAGGAADSKINKGDVLYFNFKITNIGNDPTTFRIPEVPKTIIGPGVQDPGSKPQYSIDGTTWTDIVGSATTPSRDPGQTVLVRIPILVDTSAKSNDVIKVTLGDTGTTDLQNQPRSASGGDVYTVDNANGAVTNEVNGDPINGTREAAATQQATVDSTIKAYALAKILKTHTDINNSTTLGDIKDDIITYGLSLEVQSTDTTNNGITPTSLVGTPIQYDSGSGAAPITRILVSDAIPKNTVVAADPVAPNTNWKVVYSTDTAEGSYATSASVTWKPYVSGTTDKTTIKRIGFIYEPSGVTGTNGSEIAAGTVIPNFQIKLGIVSTATSPLYVLNMAQVFGSTKDTNAPVYDDSGDNNPSNYNGSTPFTGTDTDSNGVPDTLPPANINDGYVFDPSNPNDTTKVPEGLDTGNNNTGTGDGGEFNTVTLQNVGATSLLNGPKDAPAAVGPIDNNDDFQNKSSLVPLASSAPGSTFDPSGVSFTNTFQNTSSTSTAQNISLIPTTTIDGVAVGASLPTGTVVTITYGGQSKSYQWDGTTFKAGADGSGGAIDATSEYITVTGVAQNATFNYGVEINLPANTPLSTDLNSSGNLIGGFPVPITAFIDDGTAGLGTDLTAEPRNITIDRVYTGFLKLVKFSRVVQGDGPAVGAGQGDFETTPATTLVGGVKIDPNPLVADVLRTPAPGNYIEYQVRYKNISEVQSASGGNVILKARNVTITENGTTWNGTTGNNWALDNDGDTEIDTQHVIGSAKDSNATITYYSGATGANSVPEQQGITQGTDVTKYIVTATSDVDPGQQRTFTFQRKINLTSPSGKFSATPATPAILP